MKYTCGPIASIFKKTYEVSIESRDFVFSQKNDSHREPLINIESLSIEKGLLWSSVRIVTNGDTYVLPGFSKKTAKNLIRDLKDSLQRQLATKIMKHSEQLEYVENSANQLSNFSKYISNTDIANLAKSAPEIQKYLDHSLFDEKALPAKTQEALEKFLKLRSNDPSFVKELNEQFIERAIKEYSDLFSSLEKFPLSNEQMRAAVIDEDRNLLVAAAGSGKTSSIVAKAIYLIASGLASSGEILILAYNKDAQQELEKRFTDLLGIVPEYKVAPKVKTFHGYGCEMLSQANSERPQISEFASDKKLQSRHFSRLIKDLYKSDETFRRGWREFLLIGRHQTPDLFSIETDKQYNDMLQELGAKRKKLPEGYQLMIPTIDGKEVRSIEEARICNWLALNGVEYEYERQYVNPNSPDEEVKHNPDFYYPAADLYHEHFAINSKGETPPFIPQDEYTREIEWKRKTHKKNGTKLIETHSAHVWDGTLFKVLKSQLEENGIRFNPLSEEDTDNLIAEKFDPDTDPDLFISFLNHFKANNFTVDSLRSTLENQHDKGRLSLFLDLFEAIYNQYEKRLEKDNCIDFQDQINLACELLENESIHHPYKYILVDEFQDISQDRKRLIQALLRQDETTKLFAVGDDWQSIYRFSGADIEIMTHFSDHFGASSINYLTKTYRSYQGITDIASEFVQQNPSQLKKSVSALDDSESDQVTILGYNDGEDLKEKIIQVLTSIDSLADGERLSVFLLARYNHLRPKGIGRYTNLDINFQSIHSSKGLQADYVILLNLEAGPYGFPSTVSDDPLINLVKPKPESYPHAEERRLMYVALTRAKKGAFIFSNQNYISPFAAELSKVKRVNSEKMIPPKINPCPDCNTGTLQKRIGKYGMFSGCSNYPDCTFTEALECPECGDGTLKLKKSKYGEFISCSNFPKCKYKESLRETG